MRIACIGGGPAGLTFALLMKRADPSHEVTVYERNRKGITFGWGVVFSDETLANLAAADPPLFRAIEASFVHWSEIALAHRGARVRSGGHGFSGLSRVRLLELLERRAAEVGVVLQHETSAPDVETLTATCDLVVAADGVRSGTRDRYAKEFAPTVEDGLSYYTWLGTTKRFDALTFLLAETPYGLFQVHAYPFEEGRSTFIVETTARAYEAAGLDRKSEPEMVAFLEELFAEHLGGHPLLANRSLWIRFPTVRCERWSRGRLVLLGDAAHTAHFSVGSGTKMAVEDAIELARAVQANGDVEAALLDYEAGRRTDVEKTQRAARDSRVTFEELERFADLDPLTLTMRLLSRTKGVGWENLKLRDGAFIEDVSTRFALAAASEARRARAEAASPPASPMFTPFRLRDLVLENRVVVSPMCMYSADDGVVGDFHVAHLGARAMGGAGLVMAEMTAISPEARITLGCAGIWSPRHTDAWKRIVDFVHGHSRAAIGIQLGHAGRKGATMKPWEGPADAPLDAREAWPLVSASPLPYLPGSDVPRELSHEAMRGLVAEYVRGATYADLAGFDLLEIHMAHGYLLASFLSPLTNTRGDAYGGDVVGRLRFPLEITRAVRAAWPANKPLSVRFSACDWADGGLTLDDAIAIARGLYAAGVDLVDVSTGQTIPNAKPVYGRMYQAPFAERIRHATGGAVMTVGAITTPDQINTILASGRADLVALARPHLADPNFTHRAAVAQGYDALPWPPPYAAVTPRRPKS